MPPTPILKASQLSFQYDSTPIIQDMSFTLNPGETIAIVGPSGCGKSTLLNLLGGFLKPSSGEIIGNPQRAMVWQDSGLFPWKTVEENIRLPESLGTIKCMDASLFEDLGISALKNALPHTLSGGQKQRVALARSLAQQPEVLLLDEPFAAVDAQTRYGLQEHLEKIQQQRQVSIVLVTHDIDEALYLADRVILCDQNPMRSIETLSNSNKGKRAETKDSMAHQLRKKLQTACTKPRKPRPKSKTPWLSYFAAILFLLGLWELTACLWKSPLMPHTHQVLQAFSNQTMNDMGWHIFATLKRLFVGLILGCLIGFSLGLYSGTKPKLDHWLRPIINLTFPFPKAILIPLIFLISGIGDRSRILLIAIPVFFQMFVSIRDGSKKINPRWPMVFSSLNQGSWPMYRHVYIPALIPRVLSCLRISLGTAFAILFFSETYATNTGLGYVIWEGFCQFDYIKVYQGTLLFCLVGLTLFSLIDWIDSRIGIIFESS